MKHLWRNLKIYFIPAEENNFRPKFLGGEMLFWFILFLLVLKLSIIPFLFYFPKNYLFGDIIKTELIKELNEERERLGINPLRDNMTLDKAAFLKAEDMIKKGYFDHESPDGISPWHWLKEAGYNYKLAGENLAIGFLDSDEVNKAWLASPSHRANLLNPRYRDVGISILKGDFKGNETTIVVQFFGQRKVGVKKSTAKANDAISANNKAVLAKTKKNINSGKIGSNKSVILKDKKKENNYSRQKEVIALEATEKRGQALGNSKKATSVFFSFLDSKYYKIIQLLTYGFLIFVIIVLSINIFIKSDIQHPDLIFRSIIFIGILILFSLADKITVINLLPHHPYIH